MGQHCSTMPPPQPEEKLVTQKATAGSDGTRPPGVEVASMNRIAGHEQNGLPLEQAAQGQNPVPVGADQGCE